MPRFILIHPTVWPQYTNVTDRTDRQWSDSIEQTILQMVAEKLECSRIKIEKICHSNEFHLA